MQCDIYKPKARTDLYFFVQSGTDPSLTFPHALSQFGQLEFVKTRVILPGQSLIGVSSDEILRSVNLYGFHAQGVKVKSEVSEGGAALGGGILGASMGGPVGALIGALIGFAFAEHAKKVPDEL